MFLILHGSRTWLKLSQFKLSQFFCTLVAMAWLAHKLDNALGMGAGRSSASTHRHTGSQTHYATADNCVTMDFFKDAMTATMKSFAEVTQSHLTVMEVRLAALEDCCRCLDSSNKHREKCEGSCATVEDNSFDSGAAATTLEVASKGLRAMVPSKTSARRMRRKRQTTKCCYAKEQLLQVRPLPPTQVFGGSSVHTNCKTNSDDIDALEQRVASLETTIENIGDLSWSFPQLGKEAHIGFTGCQLSMSGIPASVLELQCRATRTIQKAWRLNRNKRMKQPSPVCSKHQVSGSKASAATVADDHNFLEWSPWLFLDLGELKAISQTCTSLYDAVSVFTPFVEYGSSPADGDVHK